MTSKQLSNLPKGSYIVWQHMGDSDWQPVVYASLDEAIQEMQEGIGYPWVITERPINLTDDKIIESVLNWFEEKIDELEDEVKDIINMKDEG